MKNLFFLENIQKQKVQKITCINCLLRSNKLEEGVSAPINFNLANNHFIKKKRDLSNLRKFHLHNNYINKVIDINT